MFLDFSWFASGLQSKIRAPTLLEILISTFEDMVKKKPHYSGLVSFDEYDQESAKICLNKYSLMSNTLNQFFFAEVFNEKNYLWKDGLTPI